MSSLPDEVVERLSTAGAVRLTVMDDGAPFVQSVFLAPLHQQLYAFVIRGSHTEELLLRTGRAELHADSKDPEWSIRVQARAVAGRGVLADTRRTELMHWLPDGVAPAALLAARIHPEFVEYQRGRGSERTRAAGPVPDAAPPPFHTRWTRLATDRVILWLFVMLTLDWLSLLFLLDDSTWRPLVWTSMAVAGAAMLGGVTLWNQHNVFVRWREALTSDEGAALMLLAWESPARVRAAGLVAMATGLVVSSVLCVTTTWEVGVAAVLASGLPVLFPFHGVRHAMRRSDKEAPTRGHR